MGEKKGGGKDLRTYWHFGTSRSKPTAIIETAAPNPQLAFERYGLKVGDSVKFKGEEWRVEQFLFWTQQGQEDVTAPCVKLSGVGDNMGVTTVFAAELENTPIQKI